MKRASNKVQAIYTVVNLANAYRKMDALDKLAREAPKGTRINIPFFSLIRNPCFLLIAYSSMKGRKSGGIDNVPIENVTLAAIASLAYRLTKREYRPKPTKRVYIPKANGKMRPLGIASATDKIVQQAIRILITPAFDPTFSDRSHGFRRNRSCHSALKQLYLKCKRPT